MSEVMLDVVTAPTTPTAPSATAVSAPVAKWVAPPANPARDPSVDHRVGASRVWTPASSSRIHKVEAFVLIGTMGYFAYGLAAVFGLF